MKIDTPRIINKLELRNVADTFNGSFTNTNTADRVYTFKDATGTVAFTSDITGTNSGTNTGDNATNSQYSGLVSNATHTGDATGATALTLATVNGNVGAFGSSTAIPNFTVNAKGLITAAGTNVVIAPAGTLSGTVLNAAVVSSSLTSLGTITTGVWNGTTIAVANGGTGTTTAFTTGSIVFAGASGTYTQDNANFFWDDTNNRLGIGTATPDRLLVVTGDVSFGVATFERVNAATTSTLGAVKIKGRSTGTMANAFGTNIGFFVEGSTGGEFSAGTIGTWRNGADNTHDMVFRTILTGTASERMRIAAGGNIGVGTVVPEAKVHTYENNLNGGLGFRLENGSAAGAYKYATLGQMGTTGYSIAGWGSATVLEGSADGGLTLGAYAGDLRFQSGTARPTRMTILNSNGNVGIGTPAPTYKLEVVHNTNGGNQLLVSNSDTGGSAQAVVTTYNGTYSANYGMTGSSFTPYGSLGANTAYLYTNSGKIAIMSDGGIIQFIAGGTSERMRVDTNGNVGIGTVSTIATLHVSGTSTLDGVPVTQIITNSGDTTRRMYLGYATSGDVGFISAAHAGTAWKTLALNPSGGGVNIGGGMAAASTGVGLQVSAGAIRGLGSVSQTALAVSRLDIGVEAGTPRLIFEHGATSKVWLVDNDSGTFRFFTPGILGMSLAKDGSNNTIQYIYDGAGNSIYTLDTAASGYATIKGMRISSHDTNNTIYNNAAWGMSSTGGADAVRFDGAGAISLLTGSTNRLRVSSTGNIGLNTTSAFGSGVLVVGIANATTVPTTNPSGGGVLYVEAGALKYRGSSGTITTIANA